MSNASIGMSATAVGAVTHNKVDAAVMTDPALAIVRKQMPGLHILADTRTAEGVRSVFGVESYPSAVLYSKTEWVEKNRDTAKLLAGAITKTLSWMRSHTPEEIREKMPASFRTEDAADRRRGAADGAGDAVGRRKIYAGGGRGGAQGYEHIARIGAEREDRFGEDVYE